MMYDTILARSFSRHEQKKLGYGAFLGCLLIALSFFTVFRPYLGPLPVLSLKMSMGGGLKLLGVKDTSISQHSLGDKTIFHQSVQEENHTLWNNSSILLPVADNDIVEIKMEVECNTTEPRSDFCKAKGNAAIDGNSSTVFISPSQRLENRSWTIRPYARKFDQTAMNQVKNWSVKSVTGHGDFPLCSQNHSVPGVLFSLGGYTGNHFHDFTDVLIPLYLTSREFRGDVQFLVTNIKPWWVGKYKELLKTLSRYDVIDIDKTKDVHCFTSVIVGLVSHQELNIDPSKSPYSMKDFREFLRESYQLTKVNAIKMRQEGQRKKPRLLIVARKRTRSFTNPNEIAKIAKSLGYKVVMAEADLNVSRFAHVVNSCDVMLGVHGAGLTNMVFLPEKAVLIQVLPIGGFEWLASTDFGGPSKNMNIRYLEYKIAIKESTLIQQYPLDHLVLRDPFSVQKQGWSAFKSIYLEKQNVKLDVKRFRPTLLKALELLHQL